MYAHWKTEQLKQELRQRDASIKGRKADLIARLEFYDRNNNFDATPLGQNEDPSIILPDPKQYKDINSSMRIPSVNKQNITYYLMQFQANIKKGQVLYDSRFLYTLRAATVDKMYYIKGLVKAAMKKLLYEVNVKLDNSGSIEESSCECVAGGGINAHCKHVVVVLCAIEDFSMRNTLLKCVSCTEQLQTFHKPKKIFTDSPVLATTLTNKRNPNRVLFHPYRHKLDANEYNDRVRSIIANCQANIPFKQMLKPANPYGVDWDHNYCGSIKEYILKRFMLNEITLEQATSIERETCGQRDNIIWSELRQHRITASNFHTICNMRETTKNGFASQLLNRESFSSRATTHGVINEGVALKLYKETYDLCVVECGLFISLERPYLGASPDGLLGDQTLIEVKCPFSKRYREITPVTVPYLYLDVNNMLQLQVTSPYYYQVQGQLYCANKKYCNFIVYTYKSMEVVFVNRNDNFIKDMLVKLDNFYKDYFVEELINKYYYKDYLKIIKEV